MLGNCIIRNPVNRKGDLDKGAICESLLFFGAAHLVLDMGTLAAVQRAGFLDDLIVMLEAGLLTANYSPQSTGLLSRKDFGLTHYLFTVVKMVGDQKRKEIRNPEALEGQLLRLSNDRATARTQYRRLADLISFEDIDDSEVARLGRQDISDPAFAKEIARIKLLEWGVPEGELSFRRVEVIALADNNFSILTDIDFDKLRKFVPEADRATFGPKDLFPAVGDARLDIRIAAQRNAAFVGNERNSQITSMILQRSLGASFSHDDAARQLYDFISVATPSIREVINSGDRSPREFVALMNKADAFRRWLSKQNPTADLVKEMMREKASSGWIESLPVKAMRFGLFALGGAALDYFVPNASVAASAVDSFVVDKVAKHWRPHYFVENNLRGFLDRDR